MGEEEKINPQKSAFALLMDDDDVSKSESDSEHIPVQPVKPKVSSKKGKNKKVKDEQSNLDELDAENDSDVDTKADVPHGGEAKKPKDKKEKKKKKKGAKANEDNDLDELD